MYIYTTPNNFQQMPIPMTEQHIKERVAKFRTELEARGESVSDFCRRKELDYDAMFAVLRGRAKGRRGKAHKVFVALGIKPAAPIDSAPTCIKERIS